MPFQSTGAASPDLSTFTGTNQGFGGGGGFGFGRLLEDRWKMQKKMMEAQLKQMEEQLAAAKRAEGEAQVARQTEDKYMGRRDLRDPNRRDKTITVQEGGEGVAGPGWRYRPLQQHSLNRATGETQGMFMPQGGEFAPGSSTQGQRDYSVHEANVMARMAPQSYSATGNVTGDIPGSIMQLPSFDLGGLQTQEPESDKTYTQADIDELMSKKKGGYVPKTGPYKLHKGEIVLNSEQSKTMFPGMGPGPQKRGYQQGSVPGVPSFYGGPSAGPQSPAQSPWTGPVGRGSAPAPTPPDSPWGDLGTLGAVGLGPGSMAAMYYMKDVLKDFWKQDAPTEEALNKALEKIGNPPVKPEGVLGKAAGAEEPGGLPEAPTGISREGGIPKLTLKGAPESQAEKFKGYVDELQEKVKKSAHDEKMARANAYNLETQINKRPYADNKQLKKMMGARTQEADRHKKAEESARSEYSAIKVKQQAMDTELAKAYQLNKTKQLDTAFDAIDQYWKTAVKVDDGDDKFVEYSMGMLLPYMDQFQQLGGFSSMEETQEAMRQTMSNAYERPEEYQWLKLMLQQGR